MQLTGAKNSPERPRLRTQGVALITAMALMVVVAGVVMLMSVRTLSEIRHSADDTSIVQSLLVARGIANLGGSLLSTDVRSGLDAVVASKSNLTGRWSFGDDDFGADPPRPTPTSVIDHLGIVAGLLQDRIDIMLCGTDIDTGGGGSGSLRIYVTQETCGIDLPADVKLPAPRYLSGRPRSGSGDVALQTYSIPFVMVAEGNLGEASRNIVMQGEYRFVVGRGSFARYALFTNVHKTASGSPLWFTEETLFDGPVHTNQYFRFNRNPWFGDEVTSAGCSSPQLTACQNNYFGRRGGEFYGYGFKYETQMPDKLKPSYGWNPPHAPMFVAPSPKIPIDWSAQFVPLPDNAQNQIAAAQGDTSDPNVSGQGLYFSQNLHSLTLYAGDPNAQPLQARTVGGEVTWQYQDALGVWQSGAPYQYIQACTSSSSCDLYRYGSDKVLYHQLSDGTWEVTTGEFNGVIYGAGGGTRSIDRIRGPERTAGHSNDPDYAPPALAEFAQITIASTNGMRITRDLQYESPPCTGVPERATPTSPVVTGVCNNLSAKNVLGIYTQKGTIEIGHNNKDDDLDAPQDVTIHGVLMSGEKQVTVQDYNKGDQRGAVHLLGGMIEYNYGGFFTFGSDGKANTGFTRQFKYDERMREGLAPPYFPTVGIDGVKAVSIFSFGQREQLR